MIKKLGVFIIFFLYFVSAVFGQETDEKNYSLYYYGVVTNVNDQNMLNITQDLFAAQIRGINDVSFIDKRNDAVKKSYTNVDDDTDGNDFFSFVENNSPEKGILFFVRLFHIQSDEKWECSFFAKNTETQAVSSRTKKYDSYYKILSDAKIIVQAIVSEASGNISMETATPQIMTENVAVDLNAENVAGTWSGETDVLKIILMRGGRGFIVFSNGATMNVSMTFFSEDGIQRLRIVQRDKFNASYYPDIDRKTILEYSDSAAPIEWNLAMTERDTLEGTKKTLMAASGGIVKPTSIGVVWKKR